MAIGVVKKIPNVSNYGFIVIGEQTPPQEVFFHRSSVQGANFDDLQQGQLVTFEVVHDTRQMRKQHAVNVELYRSSSDPGR